MGTSVVVSSAALFASSTASSFLMTLKYPGIRCRVISWLLLSKYSLITLVSADPDFSDLHYNWLSVQSSTFDLF